MFIDHSALPISLRIELKRNGMDKDIVDNYDPKITPLLVSEGRRLVFARLRRLMGIDDNDDSISPGIPT